MCSGVSHVCLALEKKIKYNCWDQDLVQAKILSLLIAVQGFVLIPVELLYVFICVGGSFHGHGVQSISPVCIMGITAHTKYLVYIGCEGPSFEGFVIVLFKAKKFCHFSVCMLFTGVYQLCYS